jgi:hypothetical protein
MMNSNRYKPHSGGNGIAIQPARLAVRLIAADGKIPLFAAARGFRIGPALVIVHGIPRETRFRRAALLHTLPVSSPNSPRTSCLP